ncbi:MAG: phosphoribosylpyrophosphate synthetase [Chitinophagaceae bacterium]
MYTYDTLSEAVNDLKLRGYNIDFNIVADRLVNHHKTLSLSPEEFEIAEIYRFEGDTDPADEAVVYAIESKHMLKGIVVNGYGPGSDAASNELIKKLKEKH